MINVLANKKNKQNNYTKEDKYKINMQKINSFLNSNAWIKMMENYNNNLRFTEIKINRGS